MVVNTADTALVVSSSDSVDPDGSLLVNSADPLSVDTLDFRIVDSLSAIRKEGTRKSYLIDPLVGQRKGQISLLEEKGDVRVCICCLSYNCFEERDYCLKRCVCDYYEA